MQSSSLSPVLVIGDGGKRRIEAVDVERHVALIAQQLHVSILLPTAHAAGAEATLGIRVGLAVLTLRPTFPWIKGKEEKLIHACTHINRYVKILWYGCIKSNIGSAAYV